SALVCRRDWGRRRARRGRLRGGDGAPGDSPHPVSDDGAGPGRFGSRGEERDQRVRPEELPGNVHAAVRGGQRFVVPHDALRPRLAWRGGGGGGGGRG